MSETPVPATVELVGDDCWPVTLRGACAALFDPTSEGYDQGRASTALSMAVASLRLLTGYSVGGCPITVRPCRPSTDSTWQAYGPVPRLAWGTWINATCGLHSSTACGCGRVSELRLPGPVGRVEEVWLDGELFLDWYLVGRSLVRTDGGTWPTRQLLGEPIGAVGTFSVRYLPGRPVDRLGREAAGALACEFYKALGGDTTCRLPGNVTQVARQGVTVTQANELFPDGLTGVRLVDLYVRRHNPHRLTTPPSVWSPDVPAARGVSTPGGTPLPPPGGSVIDGGSP